MKIKVTKYLDDWGKHIEEYDIQLGLHEVKLLTKLSANIGGRVVFHTDDEEWNRYKETEAQ